MVLDPVYESLGHKYMMSAVSRRWDSGLYQCLLFTRMGLHIITTAISNLMESSINNITKTRL